MNSHEGEPTENGSKRFDGVRNFTSGLVDGVKRRRMLLAAAAGGAVVFGGQAVFHNVQSSPATITGIVRHVEPVPGEDITFNSGTRIIAEPAFRVTLDVCESSKSIDIEAGKGTNNKECHPKTGILTESEINGKINSLADGTEVTINSEDFFSQGEITIIR